MSYGNYAPFYRGNYFNPLQTQEGLNQPMSQPYQQMQPQQMPIVQQPSAPVNDMLWVLNESEATSYPVAPNNTVTLWDKNEPTIYIKSVNAQGVPSMRILDFSERTQNAPKPHTEHVCQCGKDFVKIDDFKALEAKFEDLADKFEALNTKTTTAKTKKVAESEEK